MFITVHFLIHKDEKFNNKDKGMKINITVGKKKLRQCYSTVQYSAGREYDSVSSGQEKILGS